MLEVIEGNEPLPRWLPPHLHGLFADRPAARLAVPRRRAGSVAGSGANPTLVNNVETLSNVPHILARGAGVVPVDGHRRIARDDRGHRRRRRRRSRRRRGRARHAVASGHRRRRQRRRPGPIGQGGVLRRGQPGGHRRRPRRAGQLRGVPGDRQRDGRRRVHRLRRHHLHGRRRLPAVPLPLHRVVRAVPAVQARLERDHRAPRAHRDRRRRPTTTSWRSSAGWTTSPTATAATSPSRSRSWSAASCGRSPRSSPSTSTSAGARDRDGCRSPSSSTSSTGVAVYDESFWRKRPDWTYEPE